MEQTGLLDNIYINVFFFFRTCPFELFHMFPTVVMIWIPYRGASTESMYQHACIELLQNLNLKVGFLD